MFAKVFGKRKSYDLEIFMKSGNIIETDGIKDFSFKGNDNKITYMKLEYHPWTKHQLVVETIDLSQIESIVVIYT